jgi:hydroxymethylpyrimidine pyrophosphatase-like HAD family hydrolase
LKKLIVFDLDGTIAESKSSLDDEMSALLRDLLSIIKVAVIFGGNWPQFEKQLVSNLPRDTSLENLSLLPTCGTKFYKTGQLGKNSIRRISLMRRRRKLLVPCTKRLDHWASTPKWFGGK